jgi:hypothetical protein
MGEKTSRSRGKQKMVSKDGILEPPPPYISAPASWTQSTDMVKHMYACMRPSLKIANLETAPLTLRHGR